jgi:hypothetical protein
MLVMTGLSWSVSSISHHGFLLLAATTRQADLFPAGSTLIGLFHFDHPFVGGMHVVLS